MIAVARDPIALRIAGALIVAVIAGLNFLAGLDAPRGAIWDESYYVTSTARYHHGVMQFASHPPLGLMLIAAGAALHAPAAADTSGLVGAKAVSGDRMPAGYDWAGLRIASGSAAVVATLLMYVLMLQLGQGPVGAVVFTGLFAFQSAFLAHFRAGHLDAFQIACLLAGMIALLQGLRSDRVRVSMSLLTGLAFGAALMVKLNALPLLVMPFVAVLHGAWRRRRDGLWPALRRFAAEGGMVAVGVLAAVMLTFAVHVAVSRQAPDPLTEAGRKDLAAASEPYASYIVGQRHMSPSVFLSAIADYGRFMDADFEGVPLVDAHGSSPASWLLSPQPIIYRWDSADGRTAYVGLMPNPIAWLAGALALIVTAVVAMSRRDQPPGGIDGRSVGRLLLLGWAAFMAVHLLIATQRVVYTYHSFPALVLTLLMAPLAWDAVKARFRLSPVSQQRLGGAFAALILAGFVLTAPFALHWPLSRGACEALTPFGGVECR